MGKKIWNAAYRYGARQGFFSSPFPWLITREGGRKKLCDNKIPRNYVGDAFSSSFGQLKTSRADQVVERGFDEVSFSQIWTGICVLR